MFHSCLNHGFSIISFTVIGSALVTWMHYAALWIATGLHEPAIKLLEYSTYLAFFKYICLRSNFNKPVLFFVAKIRCAVL